MSASWSMGSSVLEPQPMPEGAIVRTFTVFIDEHRLASSGLLVPLEVLDALKPREQVSSIDRSYEQGGIGAPRLALHVTAWRLPRPRTLLNRRASRRTNTRPRWQR